MKNQAAKKDYLRGMNTIDKNITSPRYKSVRRTLRVRGLEQVLFILQLHDSLSFLRNVNV